MAEALARNPIALRRFITYEALGKVPVFEAYKNFCKRFGEDVMTYVDYEFWYYRALHGELDVKYDRSVDPRQPALLELPMEMLWAIFEKANPIERLIVRKVCSRLQTCIDTMYNKIDEIRFDSSFDGPVEIKYEKDVVQYRGDKGCSVFRYSIQPHHKPAVVKNVDHVEQAIRDLSILFRNPKILQTSTVFEAFSVKNYDSDKLLKAIRGGGRPLWNGVETRPGSCIFKIPIANSDKFWKLDLSGKMVHLERR
ncbi:hypothetical protein GCK72_021046 [Caenorhabditis remanei]|uniref:F-box domain-containing protein n=1 Tax=Caenorhabditis remanei TaxID=31234 RepID=A0A6A5GIH7_CAERE|nr:hypothetical protein GCK72_021046 [Caenorhabditis remanei]KAF1754483.1 hypothetical protein GCK72_021046 [Caenorhabditis remanei]